MIGNMNKNIDFTFAMNDWTDSQLALKCIKNKYSTLILLLNKLNYLKKIVETQKLYHTNTYIYSICLLFSKK